MEKEVLEVKSRVFGSHTITLGAIVNSTDSICVPLSRDIKIWSTDKDNTRSIPTIHRSIITFVSQSPDSQLYCTCDWSGIVAVHDHSWKLKYTFRAPNPPCAAVKFLSSTKLAVLTRGTNNFRPGCVVIVELGEEGVLRTSQELRDNVWQISCHDQHLYVWKWEEPTFSLLKFNDQLQLLDRFDLMVEKSAAIGHVMSDEYIILAFQNRDLLMLDAHTMKALASNHLKAVSKSPIWAIEFVSTDHIILQQSCSDFVILNLKSGASTRTFKGPGSFCCFMELYSHILWIGTVDGVFRVEFSEHSLDIFRDSEICTDKNVPETLETSITPFLFHEISCCGLCVEGFRVLSGDLAGNVFIWDTSSTSSDPIESIKVDDSIRCLASVTSNDGIVVFIGTLTGCLLQWIPGSAPDVFTYKEDTITCIRTTSDRLCYGMVTGEIELYDISFSENRAILSHLYSLKVHHPSTVPDPRFGSLSIKAEVWSLVFSPCSTQIATCSEDQTVKITDLETQITTSEFSDHSLAVTSLAWIHHRGLSLVISCSDDNTVVIRETQTEVKLAVLHLPETVVGFCTLTYVGFIKQCPSSDVINAATNSGSSDVINAATNSALTCAEAVRIFQGCTGEVTVVCGSENGYLIARDMVDGTSIFNERVHQGSIEGMVCDEDGRVLTCASDCCVQLFYPFS